MYNAQQIQNKTLLLFIVLYLNYLYPSSSCLSHLQKRFFGTLHQTNCIHHPYMYIDDRTLPYLFRNLSFCIFTLKKLKLQITTSFFKLLRHRTSSLSHNVQRWSQDPYFHVQVVDSGQELLTGCTALGSIIFRKKKSKQPNFIAMLSAFMVFGCHLILCFLFHGF